MGVPAIVLGPNAGGYLSETNLENIEKPYWPGAEKIFKHIDYLKWCQFTSFEMRTDYTHRIIKCLQGDVKPFIKLKIFTLILRATLFFHFYFIIRKIIFHIPTTL